MVLTLRTQDSFATFITESLAKLTQAPLYLLSDGDEQDLDSKETWPLHAERSATGEESRYLNSYHK